MERLRHFPVSFFASVLALAGASVAAQRAYSVLGFPWDLGAWLLVAAAAVFVAVTAAYAVKWALFPGEVAHEFAHSVKVNFFPAFSVSLLLLSIAAGPYLPSSSWWLLALGAPAHLALTLAVVSAWMGRKGIDVSHLGPAWFIPAVGNVLVPVAALPHGWTEASWFFFAVGFVFWGVLMALVFGRVVFHHPLPDKLLPTLFILVAPPAVACISYIKLAGGADGFARVLYYFALFMLLLLLTRARAFARVKFHLSWWACSFPVSAAAAASAAMFHATGLAGFRYAGLFLAALSLLSVIVLASLTARAVARGAVCVPDKGHDPVSS